MGCRLWDRTELDMTGVTWQQQQQLMCNADICCTLGREGGDQNKHRENFMLNLFLSCFKICILFQHLLVINLSIESLSDQIFGPLIPE